MGQKIENLKKWLVAQDFELVLDKSSEDVGRIVLETSRSQLIPQTLALKDTFESNGITVTSPGEDEGASIHSGYEPIDEFAYIEVNDLDEGVFPEFFEVDPTDDSEDDDQNDDEEDLYQVRVYDGFDGCWRDVTEPVPKEKAEEVWRDKTNGGEDNTSFSDIDYYKVFPADTEMHYDSDNPAFRD